MASQPNIPPVRPEQSAPDPFVQPRRSRALGVIAFVLALIALIWVFSLSAWLLVNTPPLSPDDFLAIGSSWGIAGIGVGIVGLVLSLVAVATRRGRLWGVFGVIVGLLALVLAGNLGYFGYL